MSGGIDSSVVAHLMREQGHEVVGVRMTLWSDPHAPPLAQLLPSKCCDAQSAMRAKDVAKKLDIPLHIISLEKDFKRMVVDRFLSDYRKGLTPNPCVVCNREIKFGKLLEIADKLGCEKIATGHYARTKTKKGPDGKTHYHLLEATDRQKDQSYYLHGLTQAQLARTLFPLGTMKKEDVYKLAKRLKIPFDHTSYRESQDLCFFPEKSPQEFLKRHLKLREGDIVRRNGTIVGRHSGLPLYTIGQRRGLRIGGLKIPLEVVSKDARRNRLIVEEHGKDLLETIVVRDLRWVSWKPPEEEDTTFECRTRSLSPKRSGTFRYRGKRGVFSFTEPISLQSPGQSLVLYRGKEIVGGGIIA